MKVVAIFNQLRLEVVKKKKKCSVIQVHYAGVFNITKDFTFVVWCYFPCVWGLWGVETVPMSPENISMVASRGREHDCTGEYTEHTGAS